MWFLLSFLFLNIANAESYVKPPLSKCRTVGNARQETKNIILNGKRVSFTFLEISCLDGGKTEWRPVCSQDWLPRNNAVYCRQKDPQCVINKCTHLETNLVATHSPNHFFRGRLFCEGNEKSYSKCPLDPRLDFPKCAACKGVRIICSCDRRETTIPPSMTPTFVPTKNPTKRPTPSPTKQPSTSPTVSPTKEPTPSPTKAPVEICKSIKVMNFPIGTWNGYYKRKNNDVWEGKGSVQANLVFDHAKYEWKLVGKGAFGTSVLIPGLRAKNLLTLDQQAAVENIVYKGARYTVIFRCKKTPQPTPSPTNKPTAKPTTKDPTTTPTSSPTQKPTKSPTRSPTTKTPTISPSNRPTPSPTNQPTASPTTKPTKSPTLSPTYICKAVCITRAPVELMGHYVGVRKTLNTVYTEQDGKRVLYYKESKKEWFIKYSVSPLKEVELKQLASKRLGVDRARLGLENVIFNGKTVKLRLDCCETKEPTATPTKQPTKPPTSSPTSQPTKSPTKKPTPSPTNQPTASPTNQPTPSPTNVPTKPPTKLPTPSPTNQPTKSPVEPDCPTIWVDSDKCPQFDGAYDRKVLKGADEFISEKKYKIFLDQTTSTWYIQSPSGEKLKLTGLYGKHLNISPNSNKHIVGVTAKCGRVNLTCRVTRSPTQSPTTRQPTRAPTNRPTKSPIPVCDCDDTDVIFVLDYFSSTFVWRQQVEIVLKIIGEILRPGFRFAIIVYDVRARVLANFASNCYRILPGASNLHLILEKLTNMLLDTPPDIRSMLKVLGTGRSYLNLGVKMALDLFSAQSTIDRQKALFLFTGDYPGFSSSPCNYLQLIKRFKIQTFMYALAQKRLDQNGNFSCLVGGGNPYAYGKSQCAKYLFTYEMSLYYQHSMWRKIYVEYCDCPNKCSSDYGDWSCCSNQSGMRSRSRSCAKGSGKLQVQTQTCLRVPDIWGDICPKKCGRVQDYCNNCFFDCAAPTSWSGGYSADVCGAIEKRTCISKPCYRWANELRTSTDGDGRRGVCKAVVKVSAGGESSFSTGSSVVRLFAAGAGIISLIGGVYFLRRKQNVELQYVQIPDLDDENIA